MGEGWEEGGEGRSVARGEGGRGEEGGRRCAGVVGAWGGVRDGWEEEGGGGRTVFCLVMWRAGCRGELGRQARAAARLAVSSPSATSGGSRCGVLSLLTIVRLHLHARGGRAKESGWGGRG